MTARRTYTEADWQADQQRAQAAQKGRRILATASLRQNVHTAMARALRAAKRKGKAS